MYADDAADASRWSHAWVVGVGLMLALTTMLPAAQAAKLAMSGYPCLSTGGGGVSIDECHTSTRVANDVLAGGHPTSSESTPFSSTDATAIGSDIRVEWTFNKTQVDANVTSLHVERGQDPTLPSTMQQVATIGPNASAYLDEDAMTSGDAWYVVSANLADGSVEYSQPFRLSGIHTQ